jgi:hypothetical protein
MQPAAKSGGDVMNKTTIDGRKRRMMLDVFGSELTAKILGEPYEPATKEMKAAEALVTRVKELDRYAAPYIGDLTRWTPR